MQPSLTGRALRLLSGREHSRAELERKLQQFEEEPGRLAKVLDELQAKDFINEQRVVESVVHRRAAKLGASRIKQELQAKGLEPRRWPRRWLGCAPVRWTGPVRSGARSLVSHRGCGRACQADAFSGQPRFWR